MLEAHGKPVKDVKSGGDTPEAPTFTWLMASGHGGGGETVSPVQSPKRNTRAAGGRVVRGQRRGWTSRHAGGEISRGGTGTLALGVGIGPLPPHAGHAATSRARASFIT